MPRETPLERVLAVRQRQERSTRLAAARARTRLEETDSPYFERVRYREAVQRAQQELVRRLEGCTFSDAEALPTPRGTGSVIAPRPSPRQRAEGTALLLPELPTRASASAAAGLDSGGAVLLEGRVPTELLPLHRMLGLGLSRAATVAGESDKFAGAKETLEAAMGWAVKANKNPSLSAREGPEVSLPTGPAEKGAVRRAEKKARQAAADMRILRQSCEAYPDDTRVQLVMGLLDWSPGMVFNQLQKSMCLRWLAWLETSQKVMKGAAAASPHPPAGGAGPLLASPRARPKSLPAVRYMGMDSVENLVDYMRHLDVGLKWQRQMLLDAAREDPWVAYKRSKAGKVTSVDADRLMICWAQVKQRPRHHTQHVPNTPIVHPIPGHPDASLDPTTTPTCPPCTLARRTPESLSPSGAPQARTDPSPFLPRCSSSWYCTAVGIVGPRCCLAEASAQRRPLWPRGA